MKTKITLISVLCMLFIFSVNAEKRIYFAYANISDYLALPVEDGLETVDYRCGDYFKINNYNNFSGPWNPSTGSFVGDGAYGYRQYGYKVATGETFSCIHQITLNTSTETVADLTEVAAGWTFHIAIRTDYDGELLFALHDNTGNSFQIDITDDVYNRDNTWCEVEIDMADYIEDTEIDISKCIFYSNDETAGVRDMWSIVGTGVTYDGSFGWDDCYLTDNGTSGNSGNSEVKNSASEEKLMISGNSIKVNGDVAGFSIYNVAGTLVATVAGDETELELTSGLYIVKTAKNVFKFVR